MIDALLRDVKALGFVVTILDGARAALRSLCLADLSNGGRGIRNQVEAHLVNPLSRALFDAGAKPGGRYEIQRVLPGASTTLTLSDAGGVR